MTIQHSDSIAKLLGAMLSVQRQVAGVPKDSQGNRSKYASLEAVADALREPCLQAGLVIVQAPGEYIEGTLALTTMIAHAESGEWMRSTLQLPVVKPDPQMAGSAISYSRRYSLMAIFNLPAVDDDGEAAVRPTGSRATPDRHSPAREERQAPTAAPAPASVRPPVTGPVRTTRPADAAIDRIKTLPDQAELDAWASQVKARIERMSLADQAEVWSAWEDRSAEFRQAPKGLRHMREIVGDMRQVRAHEELLEFFGTFKAELKKYPEADYRYFMRAYDWLNWQISPPPRDMTAAG